MELFFEILLGITKTGLFVLIAEMFWGRPTLFLRNKITLFASAIITIMLSISNYYKIGWMITITPIVVLIVLMLLCILTEKQSNIFLAVSGAVASYVVSFLCNFIIGVLFGLFLEICFNPIHIYDKFVFLIGFRMLCLVFVWRKYDWLQRKVENTAVNVMILIAAFLLFFQQLMQTAFVTKDYSLINIIILLLYLTMIFTAFMLLQHNRLTAKQQAIEEDNRQMSQRLHRSKDVLGVVSQVVANEDHIDPKLRQELADFCGDEMNELQDRALGANLIGDTGIELVNVMLQKQMLRCAEENISFDVMIPTPIDGYIQSIGISVTEFMRMLNDLLKNAVKAILSTEDEPRELLLIMGAAEMACLELRIYDSGIPFPPCILEHFGERGYTTGGTGNGLADTVGTLDRYHASLALEIMEPGTDIYTKCIHISFDGKGQISVNP